MPVGRLGAALTMTGTRLLQQRQHMQAEKYLLQALQLARAMQVPSVSVPQSMSTPVCVCICVCVCVRTCHCRFASVSIALSSVCASVPINIQTFLVACLHHGSYVYSSPATTYQGRKQHNQGSVTNSIFDGLAECGFFERPENFHNVRLLLSFQSPQRDSLTLSECVQMHTYIHILLCKHKRAHTSHTFIWASY